MQKEIQDILQSVGKVIVGKDDTILQAIIAMLCGGHVLLEDVPRCRQNTACCSFPFCRR